MLHEQRDHILVLHHLLQRQISRCSSCNVLNQFVHLHLPQHPKGRGKGCHERTEYTRCIAKAASDDRHTEYQCRACLTVIDMQSSTTTVWNIMKLQLRICRLQIYSEHNGLRKKSMLFLSVSKHYRKRV